VGGLVTAIYPALQEHGGIWLGWSGKTTPNQLTMVPKNILVDKIDFLTIDLAESEVENYYSGFSNRTLWPLVHSFPTKVRMRDEEYKSYERVNRKFAEALYPYLQPQDVVWVQDYHLIPLGTNLRQLGWTGAIGFFLHTPFPPSEIFWILPWARQILDNFLHYDLVGFHTEKFRQNFENSLLVEFEGIHDDHLFRRGSECLRTGVYPIGIDGTVFHEWAVSPKAIKEANSVKKYIGNRRLILGVDRLDYTKGIVERLKTFERLLDRFPSWKRKVSMIQISAPSRTRINEYISQKRQVEMIVGEINGRLAEADWIPISYLYRAYDQQTLAGFYRMADVCLVSPLRDGMNLVAKEYVASQSGDPGVLVLSRFCGAADDLKEAIVVNPYDLDGTARALKLALEMPQAERKSRWISLMERVRLNSAKAWRDQFLADLIEKEPALFADRKGIGSRLLDGIVPTVRKDKPADLWPGNSRIGG
jgi:trehalose 6-phosphate synthase